MQKLMTQIFSSFLHGFLIAAVIVGAYIASPAKAQSYEDVRVGDVVGFGWVCKDKTGAELILAAVQYEDADTDPRVRQEIRKHCVPIRVSGNVTGVFESAVDFENDLAVIVSIEGPAGTTYWSVAFPKHTILDRKPTA
jgi:hypothetical protein